MVNEIDELLPSEVDSFSEEDSVVKQTEEDNSDTVSQTSMDVEVCIETFFFVLYNDYIDSLSQ